MVAEQVKFLDFVNDGERNCVADFMSLLWFAWLGFSLSSIQIDTFDVVNVLLHINMEPNQNEQHLRRSFHSLLLACQPKLNKKNFFFAFLFYFNFFLHTFNASGYNIQNMFKRKRKCAFLFVFFFFLYGCCRQSNFNIVQCCMV